VEVLAHGLTEAGLHILAIVVNELRKQSEEPHGYPESPGEGDGTDATLEVTRGRGSRHSFAKQEAGNEEEADGSEFGGLQEEELLQVVADTPGGTHGPGGMDEDNGEHGQKPDVAHEDVIRPLGGS